MTRQEMKRRGLRYQTDGEFMGGLTRPTLFDAGPVEQPAPAVPAEQMQRRGGATRSWAGPEGNMMFTEGLRPRAEAPAPAVPMDFRREVAGLDPVNNPTVQRFAGSGPAVPQDKMPRLFTDSDGRARAGFNMGPEGAAMGLVPADAGGVPVGVEMIPVSGLSQGSMEIGVPVDPNRGYSPRIALGPDDGPVATPESYARAVNAMGGFQAPPMNAREAALQADRDATRTNRWAMEGGPTSAMNRRSQATRSQGAALDALTRQTDEQIRQVQGTPQAVMNGDVGSRYTPREDGRGPGKWSDVVKPVKPEPEELDTVDRESGMKVSELTKGYLKAISGESDSMDYKLAMIDAKTDEERARVREQYKPSAQAIAYYRARLIANGRDPEALAGSAAPGAGTATGRPSTAGGTDPLAEFRRKPIRVF